MFFSIFAIQSCVLEIVLLNLVSQNVEQGDKKSGTANSKLGHSLGRIKSTILKNFFKFYNNTKLCGGIIAV